MGRQSNNLNESSPEFSTSKLQFKYAGPTHPPKLFVTNFKTQIDPVEKESSRTVHAASASGTTLLADQKMTQEAAPWKRPQTANKDTFQHKAFEMKDVYVNQKQDKEKEKVEIAKTIKTTDRQLSALFRNITS